MSRISLKIGGTPHLSVSYCPHQQPVDVGCLGAIFAAISRFPDDNQGIWALETQNIATRHAPC